MRNILKSRLGRASIALAIAGSAIIALGASAEARPYEHGNQGHWNHGYQHYAAPYHWDHARWYGGYRGYYGPGYYAPPVVAYPAPYYGPPSLNFNIPLG